MGIARTLGRTLLAAIFIFSGLEVLAKPEGRAKAAKPVVDAVADVVPVTPRDPVTAVTINAIVHIGAGAMLAAGILPRLAALALATSMVPTTLAGHRFWELEDPAQRGQQRVHFLKNTAILGGLLVVALD
ncbi:MAG: DoxX family protein [Chloroflexi bacterium]|nr:MAG: DoxX family protein [Chloroflexota bacterium]